MLGGTLPGCSKLPRGSSYRSLDTESVSATIDSSISTDEPTLDEVIRAVKKLRNGRAPGPDGILDSVHTLVHRRHNLHEQINIFVTLLQLFSVP